MYIYIYVPIYITCKIWYAQKTCDSQFIIRHCRHTNQAVFGFIISPRRRDDTFIAPPFWFSVCKRLPEPSDAEMTMKNIRFFFVVSCGHIATPLLMKVK